MAASSSSSSLIWGIAHDNPRILVSSSYCPPPLIWRRRRSVSVGSSGRGGGGGFIGGFVLGGILAGTLTCIYAPQISEALMGATSNGSNKKNKLPQFAHDKEEEEEADHLGNDSNQNPPEVLDNEEEITRESIAAKIAEINAMMGGNPPNPRYN